MKVQEEHFLHICPQHPVVCLSLHLNVAGALTRPLQDQTKMSLSWVTYAS